MNKKIVGLMLMGLMLVGAKVQANCGNDNGNGNGCSGNTGPQGPMGPQGPAGLSGTNGTNGTNGQDGTNGKDGKNGKDGQNASTAFKGTDLAADVAVRLVDTQYLQLQAYDTYVFGSTPGQDIFGNGSNSTIGARIVIKVGKSYEERQNEALKRQVEALEAIVSRMQH